MERDKYERNYQEHKQHVLELEQQLSLVDGNLNEFYTKFMSGAGASLTSGEVKVSNQFGFLDRSTIASEGDRTSMGLTKGTMVIQQAQ